MKANKHLLLWSSLGTLLVLFWAAFHENYLQDWRRVQRNVVGEVVHPSTDRHPAVVGPVVPCQFVQRDHARRVGVRGITFSLGFGPKLLKYTKGDTEYCVSAIPLGGYVKMAGENPDDPRSGQPDEFLSKTKWQRFQILIMGPAMNIILAVVVMAVTPGPDMILYLGKTIAQSRRAGLVTFAGAVSGVCFHTALAAFGLSALLAASATAFTILKIAGEVREMIARGEQVCNLTVGDFDPREFPPPAQLLSGIQRALAAGHTNYPPSNGIPELREREASREREMVAYHESGHAIVASVLPGLDPVHKISIVQRGFGALGYTMQLPLEDRYLLTRRDLENQMAVLLGGRTAEEIAIGEISTGAQNDLQRATDIARAMVTEFGMSEMLGAVNYDGHKRGAFLDMPFVQERGNYAEETALKIDTEVKRILTEAHDTARRVLRDRRGTLDELSERLLEKEVIESDELKAIIGPLPPKDPDAVPPQIPPVAPVGPAA